MLLQETAILYLSGIYARGPGLSDWTVGLDCGTGLSDWTVGLDCWTGLSDWTVGLDCRTGLLDWTVGLDCRTGLTESCAHSIQSSTHTLLHYSILTSRELNSGQMAITHYQCR